MKHTLTDTPQRGRLVHFDSQKNIWVETNGWFMFNQQSSFVLYRKIGGRYWRIINFLENVEGFYPEGLR